MAHLEDPEASRQSREQERHSYLDRIKNYGRDLMFEADTMCSICLDEFHKDDEVVQLPCTHYFHYKCADLWLERNESCPYCRLHLNL